MTKLLFALSVALFCHFIFAQNLSSNPVKLVPTNIKFDSNGYPWVDCSFNGVLSSFGCLLDTGAQASVIPHALNEALKDSPILDSYEITSYVGDPTCDDLHVADVGFAGYSAALSEVLRCQGMNPLTGNKGTIGINALTNSIWKLDMPGQRLSKEEEIPPTLNSETLKRDSDGSPIITVNVGRNRFLASFDTGSPNTYMDISLYRPNMDLFRVVKKGSLDGVPIKIVQLKQFYAVGHPIKSDQIVVMDFLKNPIMKALKKSGYQILLGEDVIRNYIWHLDLKSNLWALE